MKIKLSLHNHTITSDGELSPDQLLEYLRDAGFDVIAITDHMKIAQPWKIPKDIIFIPGIEWFFHGGFEIICLFPFTEPERGFLDLTQTRVKWVAHPIYGFSDYIGIERKALASTIEYLKLDGYELYNGDERQLTKLEELSIKRRLKFKVNKYAVDDFHIKGQEFRSWMEMNVPDLDVDLIIKNLVTGNYTIKNRKL